MTTNENYIKNFNINTNMYDATSTEIGHNSIFIRNVFLLNDE